MTLQKTGVLYLVPTPIGNLEDITLRALTILKEVDFILAEDTRNSGFLLKHYSIESRLKPFHQHNEHHVLPQLIQQLEFGNNIALISDAGTPGISDPGFLLVRECVRKNIRVECLPGAVAFIPALIVSGFPADRFCFEGFLPHKKGRQTRINRIAQEDRTIIMYESPHRIIKLLEQLAEACGETREVSVSRELTKKFEETVRGPLSVVLEHFGKVEPKGEFVVVIKGREE